MEENTSIYDQCESAFESILNACESGKNSEPIAKSKDGKYIFYKLENGLYLWHLVNRFESESSLDIVTKCNPTNIENVLDVYPAIFKSTDDRSYYYNNARRKESIRFEIYQNFQNKDFHFSELTSWASIRSEKIIEDNPDTYNIGDMLYKIRIIDRACLPVQPNTPEDLLKCSSDVQHLLLQSKEKSSDERLIRAYDDAIRLYDMFINFSKDLSLNQNIIQDEENKEGLNDTANKETVYTTADEEEIDLQERLNNFLDNNFHYRTALEYLEIKKGKVIPKLQDLSKIMEIMYNQRDLNSDIDRYHLEIEHEKIREEIKKAKEKEREKEKKAEEEKKKNMRYMKNNVEEII